jgi:hypothetical protein
MFVRVSSDNETQISDVDCFGTERKMNRADWFYSVADYDFMREYLSLGY